MRKEICYLEKTDENVHIVKTVNLTESNIIPRVGEKVVFDNADGKGQIYAVIDVHYSLDLFGIDVFIKHISDISSYMGNFSANSEIDVW